MRGVILNADDFGYSSEVNRAVIRAHEIGALTSASLMVAEPAWREAVEMAHSFPTLGVGLHVSVTHDRAVLGREHIPELIGLDGRLGIDPFKTGIKYAFNRRTSPQLFREMEAQFKRFAETGLPWSHADGHQHFHLHPQVWRHFIDLCDAFGVHRVRLPHEELRSHFRSGGDRSAANAAALLAFRALRKKAIRDLESRTRSHGKQYFYCDRVYGLMQTGNMNAHYLEKLLPRIAGATCEIYFHPASPHSRPISAQTTDAYPDVEAHALMTSELRKRLLEAGMVTGNYAQVESLRNGSVNSITTGV